MNGALKVIAAVTMLLDHIGAILFPTEISFRVVGRLALPIFAWCIAQGYRHTSNLQKYICRLLLFAIISQFPYELMSPTRLNILFCFTAALLLLYLKDRYSRWIYLALFPLGAISLEYGIYAILLVIIFHELEAQPLLCLIAFTIATGIYTMVYGVNLQLFSIVALPLIFSLKNIHFKLPHRIFYWFYPVHLVVLTSLKMLL